MRRISTRLDDRLLALVLLAAACASFLLPFARVTYEDVATVSGVTLVTADVDDEANGKDNLLASAAQTGGPFATLAVAFAVLSGFGVVVGARGVAAVCALLALVSMIVLGLRAFFTLVPAAVDLRPGFWLALALLSVAAATTGRMWSRDVELRRPTSRAASLVAVAGAILLAALFVPAEPLEFRPGDPFAQPPFEFLAPEWRGYFWRALEPVTLATAALVAAAALARGALLAAGAAFALGAAALLRGTGAVAGALRDANPLGYVPDGPFLLVVAGLLSLAGAVLAVGRDDALMAEGELSSTAVVLAAAGAVAVAAAAAIPYDLGGERDLTRNIAVLHGPEAAAGVWRALAPLGLAALVAAAALGHRRLPREFVAGILVAAGGAAAAFYVAHLTPATDDDGLTSFGPGAVVGIVGAAVVVAAGWLSRQRRVSSSR